MNLIVGIRRLTSMDLVNSSLAGAAKDAEAGLALWKRELASNEVLTEEGFALGMVRYDCKQYRQAAAFLMFYGTALQTRMYGLQLYFRPEPWWRRVLDAVSPFTAGVALGLVGYYVVYPRVVKMVWPPSAY
jgi:hypothetical protein